MGSSSFSGLHISQSIIPSISPRRSELRGRNDIKSMSSGHGYLKEWLSSYDIYGGHSLLFFFVLFLTVRTVIVKVYFEVEKPNFILGVPAPALYQNLVQSTSNPF